MNVNYLSKDLPCYSSAKENSNEPHEVHVDHVNVLLEKFH